MSTRGALRVGSVLVRSLRLTARHAVAFLLVQALAMSPLFAYRAAAGALHLAGATHAVLSWTLTVVLGLVATAVVTHVVVGDLAGRPVGLASGFRLAATRFAALLRLAVLLGVVFGLGFFLCFAFARFVGGQVQRVAAGLADRAGLAAMFLPLLGLYARLYLAAPVVVVEDVGAVEALRRTLWLSSGEGWRIFAVLLALLAGLAAIAAVVPAGWLALVVGVLTASWLSTACAVTYHDLRTGKEGLSSDELARVFS